MILIKIQILQNVEICKNGKITNFGKIYFINLKKNLKIKKIQNIWKFSIFTVFNNDFPTTYNVKNNTIK